MKPTPEDALKVLQEQQADKIKEFNDKISALCEEYKMDLKIQQTINIVPRA